MVILAFVGCASTPQYVILEDMPYPGVADLKLDGIPFGFKALFYSKSYGMDIRATTTFNRLPEQAIRALKSMNTSYPRVDKNVMGTQIKYENLLEIGDHFDRSRIIYSMTVDDRGTLLEFEKRVDVRNSSCCSTDQPVTADELRQSLTKTFGRPHSGHAKDHGRSHEDTYWWGVDKKVLFRGGKYDFGNAYWYNRFYGKVIRANLYQYKNRDMLSSVTMTDNYQWLEKMRRAVHED